MRRIWGCEALIKQSEFVRWLRAQGVHIELGGKHLKLYYNGKRSYMPNHPNQELANGTMREIKKQLGL